MAIANKEELWEAVKELSAYLDEHPLDVSERDLVGIEPDSTLILNTIAGAIVNQVAQVDGYVGELLEGKILCIPQGFYHPTHPDLHLRVEVVRCQPRGKADGDGGSH